MPQRTGTLHNSGDQKRGGRMPRRLTLSHNNDVRPLLHKGRRMSGKGFQVVFEWSEQFRYMIIVPKRLGNAAKRNRIRRLYREAIRLNRQTLKQNVRMALIVRELDPAAEFQAIDAEIARICEAIGRLR